MLKLSNIPLLVVSFCLLFFFSCDNDSKDKKNNKNKDKAIIESIQAISSENEQNGKIVVQSDKEVTFEITVTTDKELDNKDAKPKIFHTLEGEAKNLFTVSVKEKIKETGGNTYTKTFVVKAISGGISDKEAILKFTALINDSKEDTSKTLKYIQASGGQQQ